MLPFESDTPDENDWEQDADKESPVSEKRETSIKVAFLSLTVQICVQERLIDLSFPYENWRRAVHSNENL